MPNSPIPLRFTIQALAESWHLRETGEPVKFEVCLLNRYEGGDESLGWHADRTAACST